MHLRTSDEHGQQQWVKEQQPSGIHLENGVVKESSFHYPPISEEFLTSMSHDVQDDNDIDGSYTSEPSQQRSYGRTGSDASGQDGYSVRKLVGSSSSVCHGLILKGPSSLQDVDDSSNHEFVSRRGPIAPQGNARQRGNHYDGCVYSMRHLLALFHFPLFLTRSACMGCPGMRARSCRTCTGRLDGPWPTPRSETCACRATPCADRLPSRPRRRSACTATPCARRSGAPWGGAGGSVGRRQGTMPSSPGEHTLPTHL